MLLQALKDYQGTMVFVSHDRYFVDALASRVVEVAEHRATSYIGNYEDFLRAKSGEGDLSHSDLRVEQARTETSVPVGQGVRLMTHAERKAVRREERKRQKSLAEIEAKIEALEQTIGDLTLEMQDPAMAVDHARLGKLVDRHAELQSELDTSLEIWEALQETHASGDAK